MKRREGVEVGRNLEHLDIFLKCFLWETLYKYSYFVYIIHKKLVPSLQLSHHSWISRYLKWFHILVKPELVPFTLEGILHEE